MKINRHAKIIELINKYHIGDAGGTGRISESGRIQSDTGNGIQRYS